jgi:hypothetical protein
MAIKIIILSGAKDPVDTYNLIGNIVPDACIPVCAPIRVTADIPT